MTSPVLRALVFALPLTLFAACENAEDCPRGGSCVCEENETCTFICDGVGCTFGCRAGADCEYRCAEGNCQGSCDPAATMCTMKCGGGDCQLDCNGVPCRMQECTDNCSVDCDGADVCENSCTDPDRGCSTDPT